MDFLLTGGIIKGAMEGRATPPKSYLQILGSNLIGESNWEERVQLDISDGDHSYTFVTLAGLYHYLFEEKRLERFTVICADKILCSRVNSTTVMEIVEMEVVVDAKHVNKVLGNPVDWADELSSKESTPLSQSDNVKHPCSPVGGSKAYNELTWNIAKTTPVKAVMCRGSGGGVSLNLFGSPGATKKQKVEIMDFPLAPFAAIKDINPDYTKATIRAHVAAKGKIIPWSNSQAKGSLFSMDLQDPSGKIKMTGFNQSVEMYYDMIEVDHIYFISNFNVKPANKKFTNIAHDYELTFNNDTQVVRCVDDTLDVPAVTHITGAAGQDWGMFQSNPAGIRVQLTFGK